MSAPGLQHERTALAWQRTSLAMLANGILLLVHRAHGGGVPTAQLWLAGLAAGLALMTYAIGRVRRRTLRNRPAGQAAPMRYIAAVGLGQAALAVLVLCTLPR